MTQKKIFVYHMTELPTIQHYLWENSVPSVGNDYSYKGGVFEMAYNEGGRLGTLHW